MVVGRGGRGGGSIVVGGVEVCAIGGQRRVGALILGYTSAFINLLTFEVKKRKRKKRRSELGFESLPT